MEPMSNTNTSLDTVTWLDAMLESSGLTRETFFRFLYNATWGSRMVIGTLYTWTNNPQEEIVYRYWSSNSVKVKNILSAMQAKPLNWIYVWSNWEPREFRTQYESLFDAVTVWNVIISQSFFGSVYPSFHITWSSLSWQSAEPSNITESNKLTISIEEYREKKREQERKQWILEMIKRESTSTARLNEQKMRELFSQVLLIERGEMYIEWIPFMYTLKWTDIFMEWLSAFSIKTFDDFKEFYKLVTKRDKNKLKERVCNKYWMSEAIPTQITASNEKIVELCESCKRLAEWWSDQVDLDNMLEAQRYLRYKTAYCTWIFYKDYIFCTKNTDTWAYDMAVAHRQDMNYWNDITNVRCDWMQTRDVTVLARKILNCMTILAMDSWVIYSHSTGWWARTFFTYINDKYKQWISSKWWMFRVIEYLLDWKKIEESSPLFKKRKKWEITKRLTTQNKKSKLEEIKQISTQSLNEKFIEDKIDTVMSLEFVDDLFFEWTKLIIRTKPLYVNKFFTSWRVTEDVLVGSYDLILDLTSSNHPKAKKQYSMSPHHPHVSWTWEFCPWSFWDVMLRAARNNDYVSMAIYMFEHLTTYNQWNPFQHMSSWYNSSNLHEELDILESKWFPKFRPLTWFSSRTDWEQHWENTPMRDKDHY